MGDPKKKRKKFSKPLHLWQKERIEGEKVLVKEYGFKNKQEIWKMNSMLRNFSNQAKVLISLRTPQAEKEKKQLLHKLQNLGLIKKTAQIEDVLGITLRNVLERRLQTLVLKKGMANSIRQARQFITHEHIAVGERKITVPSYLVSVKEEGVISFAADSGLSDSQHPGRVLKERK